MTAEIYLDDFKASRELNDAEDCFYFPSYPGERLHWGHLKD